MMRILELARQAREAAWVKKIVVFGAKLGETPTDIPDELIASSLLHGLNHWVDDGEEHKHDLGAALLKFLD